MTDRGRSGAQTKEKRRESDGEVRREEFQRQSKNRGVSNLGFSAPGFAEREGMGLRRCGGGTEQKCGVQERKKSVGSVRIRILCVNSDFELSISTVQSIKIRTNPVLANARAL